MEKHVGISTFKGNPVTLLGNMAKSGIQAPDFHAFHTDLSPFNFRDIQNQIKLISVVPSIDTGVCDLQTRRFNEEAANYAEVTFISISCDLPFALGRYCGVAGIQNVITLSDYKDTDFGLKYGFLIDELRLLNRGILLIDKNNMIQYVEYVKENTTHPDYDKAMNFLKKMI